MGDLWSLATLPSEGIKLFLWVGLNRVICYEPEPEPEPEPSTVLWMLL